MRVAFLAGANSIHAVRWIKYFAERGHEIIWISLAPPIDEAQGLTKRVIFYELKPSPLSDINGPFAIRYLPFAVGQLKKILKSNAPNLIHVHSAGTYGLVGTLANFHPLVLTPWGTDILLTSALKKPLVKFIVKNADAYTCDGENTSKKLVELGAGKNKIHLIRFGTDVEKFRPLAENRKQKIENRIRIISLRSLEPVYDIETLIKAAAIVVKQFTKVEFILAGGGSQKEYLQKLAENLNLMRFNLIRFVGKVNNEELPSLLQTADIYVSTALSDSGLSSSTAEAMATALPVIVTDSGDNREWVDSEFVIPVKSPEVLAEKIITLIKNKNLAQKTGEKNREKIESENNYYIEMTKVEKLYEKVIASR